jgi:nicotinamidase-related amidase
VRSIYLLCDMQNDLTSPDGPSAKSPLGLQIAERDVVKRSAAAIANARAAGHTVGFVRVGFSPGYREWPSKSPVFGKVKEYGLLQLGGWGAELNAELPAEPEDWQIVKHRVSPFYGTSLDLQLRVAGIERIYCSGVSTQAVVQSTVRDAHDRDYEVVVLDDCCSSDSEEEHLRSITTLSGLAKIVDSAEAFLP